MLREHRELSHVGELKLLFKGLTSLNVFAFSGSLIIGLDPVQDDWFRGKTLDGQVGTFHAGYCWELGASNYRKFNVR